MSAPAAKNAPVAPAKNEKPTLAGVSNKTRKRNIVIPVDPGSFADAIVQIVQDASEGVSVETDLEEAAKTLDSADLEWNRYGDTLFEVFFAGGRMASGAQVVEEGLKLEINILACKTDREAILPFIKLFVGMTRRRPFLIRGLENTFKKLLLSLEFLDDEARRKVAIALAMTFSQKLPMLPENVFHVLFADRLVTKGTVLEFVTHFFQEFLVKDPLEELVSILSKAKVASRLLEFFPPSKRTLPELEEHFKAAGLENLVEWNHQRELDSKIKDLENALFDLVGSEDPAPPAEVLALAKGKKAESNLPDADVLRSLWIALVKSINFTGKNQQQIMQALVQRVKAYRKVLSAFATSAKVELSLLCHLQCQCYEDNRLLKLFVDIVRLLYDAEIVGEDTVLHWHKKGSHPKGRNVFLKDTEAFIKWLEEAEEDAEEA